MFALSIASMLVDPWLLFVIPRGQGTGRKIHWGVLRTSFLMPDTTNCIYLNSVLYAFNSSSE
eukprot:snap_masked-scaffold_7-processed-gene-8.37-mRNA-1 protein AED:1.00 eAED:1.00 QI:0/0/0/0/1/1/3/0/61